MKPGPDPHPRPIAASLDQLLGTLDAPSVDVIDIVFRDWASVVGDDLAAHSRPTAIDGDLLVIEAADAAWAGEFRWLEKELLERLETVTESTRITRLQVRVSRRS